MRTFELLAVVDAEHKVTLQLPPDIEPGAHRIVVVIEERRPAPPELPPLGDFPIRSYGSWPADLSLRREDLYGDDGR